MRFCFRLQLQRPKIPHCESQWFLNKHIKQTCFAGRWILVILRKLAKTMFQTKSAILDCFSQAKPFTNMYHVCVCFSQKGSKNILEQKMWNQKQGKKKLRSPQKSRITEFKPGIYFPQIWKMHQKKQAKKPNHVNPGLSSLAQLLKIVRTFFVASNQKECKSENSVQLQETLRAKEKTNHSQTNKTFCVNSETRSFCAKPATVFVVRPRE